MSQLLLVEDDNSLGLTLKERLEKEGFSVSWSTSERQARELFEAKNFDLVILDVGLPDGHGFELAQWIRTRSQVPFVFVTAQGGAEDRLRGYELGAEEYIPKPFHLKEFLIRIKHVLHTHGPLSASLKVEDVEIDLEGMTIAKPGDQKEYLTQKEHELLKMLVESTPKVLSRSEILDRVWGEGSFPSNRTVDNSILRLRQLLGHRAGQWIRSVRGVGYQWCEPSKGDGNE